MSLSVGFSRKFYLDTWPTSEIGGIVDDMVAVKGSKRHVHGKLISTKLDVLD